MKAEKDVTTGPTGGCARGAQQIKFGGYFAFVKAYWPNRSPTGPTGAPHWRRGSYNSFKGPELEHRGTA
jgi:hypothetical protein